VGRITKKKCKHKWQYIELFSVVKPTTMGAALGSRYALFICPYCEEEKRIEVKD